MNQEECDYPKGKYGNNLLIDDGDDAAKVAPNDLKFQFGTGGKGNEGEDQFVKEQEVGNIFGMDKIEDKRPNDDSNK